MSPHPERESANRLKVAPHDIVLSQWPLRDGSISAWSFAAICVLVALLAGYRTGNSAAGAACFSVLAVTSWRLWIPVQFVVGANGVTQSFFGRERRTPWNCFESFVIRTRGVVLLPVNVKSALLPPRGLQILWNGRRDELISLLQFYIGDRRPGGSSVTRLRDPSAVGSG